MGQVESPTKLDALSNKQSEVLALIAQGYTSKEGAVQLGISPGTFDKHAAAICSRLGVATRGEAARLYRSVFDHGYRLPPQLIPIAAPPINAAETDRRVAEEALRFSDATVASGAPWDLPFYDRVPELRIDRLGPGGRFLAMAGGAALIAAGLILTLGVASGLQNLIT